MVPPTLWCNPRVMKVVSGNIVTEYLIQFNLIYRRLSNLKSDILPIISSTDAYAPSSDTRESRLAVPENQRVHRGRPGMINDFRSWT